MLTLSVRDSAAMLDCIAGPELGDPYCAHPLQPTSVLRSLEQPVRQLKIGLLIHWRGEKKPDAGVAIVFEKTIKLTSLGHELIPVVFPTDITKPCVAVLSSSLLLIC